MAKPDQSRRQFITALISLSGILLFLGEFLRPKMPQRKTLLSVQAKEIPPSGALVYRESRLAIIRDGGEIYALSLVCTHLGCTVSVTPTELLCPCHGSVFDRRGNVLKGPANRALVRHKVEERDGRVSIMM